MVCMPWNVADSIHYSSNPPRTSTSSGVVKVRKSDLEAECDSTPHIHKTMDERETSSRINKYRKFVADNADALVMLVEVQALKVIKVIGAELEAFGKTAVFFDYSSMYGYLSSMLLYTTKKGQYYSRCDYSACENPELSVFAESHRRGLHVNTPSNHMLCTASYDDQCYIEDLITGKTVHQLTHMFFHVNFTQKKDTVLEYLSNFRRSPTLQVIWVYSKHSSVKTVPDMFSAEVIKCSSVRGSNGGIFNIYRFERRKYLDTQIPDTVDDVDLSLSEDETEDNHQHPSSAVLDDD